jgi:hypothetical protein
MPELKAIPNSFFMIILSLPFYRESSLIHTAFAYY